jgi:hypothetical protein
MINLRLYRGSLLFVPLAIVIAMFSLQSVPDGRVATIAPDSFDGARAAALARNLAELAPSPEPGGDSDETLARLVTERFGEIAGVQVSEQTFEADGKELRNVIAVLPGESERQIVLMAGRDASRGPGGSAAASTAALLEIASGFGGSTHSKTLVFVSSDGTWIGAEGARQFISGYSDIDRVEEVVVLSQPAAITPRQPLLVPWSSGPQSTSIELARTAATAIANETNRVPADESTITELSRLAFPSGLGEQAPLIEEGIDAVRISSSGERPPDPEVDEPDDISATTLGEFGRAALSTMLALDEAEERLEHGPNAYVGLVGNLLPGWALSVVALSLILPLLLVAVEAVGRARRPEDVVAALRWVLSRSLPFAGALLATYVFCLVGLIPTPEFPYDPGAYGLDTAGKIASALIAAALIAAIVVVQPWRPPPFRARAAAASATVAVIAVAGLGLWITDPYLALVLVPALHAWLLLCAEETAVGSLLAALITVVALAPAIAFLVALGSRLGVGSDALWQLLILLGDRQIGFVLALLGCVLIGAGLAAVALARSRIGAAPPEVSPGGRSPAA